MEPDEETEENKVQMTRGDLRQCFWATQGWRAKPEPKSEITKGQAPSIPQLGGNFKQVPLSIHDVGPTDS